MIDLATAFNVGVLLLNLVLVWMNIMILQSLLALPAWFYESDAPPSKMRDLVKGFTNKAKDTKPFPVHSASDQKIVEREELRREADRIENDEQITKAIDSY